MRNSIIRSAMVQQLPPIAIESVFALHAPIISRAFPIRFFVPFVFFVDCAFLFNLRNIVNKAACVYAAGKALARPIPQSGKKAPQPA